MVTQAVERGSGVTLWRQIAERLSRDLLSGALKPGDRLPTELDLASRYAVNRHTVRRAVAALADQGYLRVEQGRGTFVAEHMLDYVLGRRTRFHANLEAQGREPSGRVFGARVERADAAVARELHLKAGTRVLVIEHVGEADGVPITHATHYFPAERFRGLAELYTQTTSLTAALKALGVPDYTRKVSRLSARLPSEVEARHLGQAAARPVLQAEAVNVDPEGRPIQYSITQFAGDRVQLVVEPDTV
ncbi:MAG: phosphonate metabolism transcriptional regulator PhnF [Proteobacteria bacterium]|nr:phosphonate metabolism transcriptional regulator PhnF [Pseudomonadota bacterium]